jgi:hypothetical protein
MLQMNTCMVMFFGSDSLIERPALKELETESAGMQTTTLTQLFVSLPRLGGGWCANQSPEPTWLGASVLRLSVRVHHATVPTWLSFGRSTTP